jgi:hypothetical protein
MQAAYSRSFAVRGSRSGAGCAAVPAETAIDSIAATARTLPPLIAAIPRQAILV